MTFAGLSGPLLTVPANPAAGWVEIGLPGVLVVVCPLWARARLTVTASATSRATTMARAARGQRARLDGTVIVLMKTPLFGLVGRVVPPFVTVRLRGCAAHREGLLRSPASLLR